MAIFLFFQNVLDIKSIDCKIFFSRIVSGIFVLMLAITPFFVKAQEAFIAEQMKFDHVKTAVKEKSAEMEELLKASDIEKEKLRILLIAYKDEKELLLYAKNKTDKKYRKLKTYSICESSGKPGPKREQGDLQVPEGFYQINHFNPLSNYYLSLGINYPNTSDLKKTKAKDPGGAIYIHGNCVTIGCIPITDEQIKELYIFAMNARAYGQKNIPVYIFPFKMTDENYTKFRIKYRNNTPLLSFWENIKTGYDKFISAMNELKINFDKSGNYHFE